MPSESSRRTADGAGDEPAVETLIEELEAAADALEDRRAAVARRGVEETTEIADLYDEIDTLLDRYEERATDWDDLEGYAEFRESLNRIVADLSSATPEDVRDAVTAADDELITGAVAETLSAADFKQARELLEPLRRCAERRDRWRTARERYRQARSAIADRLATVDTRIDELDRVQALGEADLDAPVSDLRAPITKYDEGVRTAFTEYRHTASSRALLAFVATASRRPLVEYRTPPTDLVEYLEVAEIGDKPLDTVLEYLEFSRSKLAHYVDDADRFRAVVAPNQTYLERLSGDPLCLGWPPPQAERLRFRCRELIPLVGRVADEQLAATLREIRDLATSERYERLRRSAIARAELDETQRERMQTGAVATELAELRERRQRLRAALNEHPSLGELDDP